jgi:glycosyltransferase involved in cell wall biosynthesis
MRWMLPFIAMLRVVKHRILWTCIRARVDGVFAISRLAVAQLMRFGVDGSKLFPFGYFVPAIDMPCSNASRIPDDVIKLIFVGTVNKTKGIDLAVAAIDALNRTGLRISLDVYGPGDVGHLGLPKSGVIYKGMIQFGHAQVVIADYDCLILPSLYDGWGVVVNEALLAGVPVICSKQAGSSVLIDRWRCGAVFDNSIKDSLVDVLEDLCDRRAMLLSEWRINTKLVRKFILPSVGARYIADVLFDRLDDKAKGVCSAYQ